MMQLLHHSLAANKVAKLDVSRSMRQKHVGVSCSMSQPDTSSSSSKTSSLHGSDIGPAALTESLQRQGLQGARVIHTQQEPIPAKAAAIKTMVLVRDDLDTAVQHVPALQSAAAPAAAVAVLLLAGHKVDLRAVAQHMQLPKGSLRLATPDEAEHSTGYELGCIPPIGHKHPLRTLVDAHITQQPPQQLLCAGGGQQDTQLLVSVQQLMAATAGEPGAFSTTKQPTVGLTQQSRPQQQPVAQEQKQQQHQQQEQKQQQLGPSAFAHLPLPWADGAQEVELVGVLAQRRRIAKLLLFATLVPETVPALPSDGTAAYVRRLWRHPASGMPCEVQLIMGKTIERQLGRDGAAALFDKLKVGAVVALRGRPQQHPQPVGAAAAPGSNGSDVQHNRVLDVVVQEIRVLHKNRDTLARAILAARRRGHTSVVSALDLEQLTAGQASAGAGADTDADAVVGNSTTQQWPSRQSMPTQRPGLSAMRQPMASAGPGHAPAAAKASSAAAAEAPSMAQPVQQQDAVAGDYYTFPLPSQSVSLVQDLEGVVRMHQAVLQQALQHNGDGGLVDSSQSMSSSSSSTDSRDDAGIVSSSSTSSSASLPVVGIDCEWQPYERGSPKTPVALLQLATRDQVFLVDMLAICRQQDQHGQQQGADGHNACGNYAPNSSNSSSQVCWDGSAVSAAEAALAYVLQQLFVHQGIEVIGFGLKGDLQRLANSYPWLLSTAVASVGSSCGSNSSSDNGDSGHQPADYTSQHTTSSTALPDSACELIISNEAASSSANESDVDDEQAGGVWVVHQAVDLQQLCNKSSKPGSRHTNGNAGSLSSLVRKVLGKPLDKSQQASSWGSRPLTQEQLVYAANDAHVLTVLYDKLVGTDGYGCDAE